jgi:Domain of unknown function (DUF222)
MSGTLVIEQGGTAAAATLLVERLRASVTDTSALLAGLPGAASAVGNTALGPLFRQLDDLKRLVDVAQVVTLREALSRGVVAESDCPTATSWVIQWAPSFRSGGAAQLVRVTQATRAVRNGALAAAVLGARVGVRNAAVVLVEMDKLKPRLGDGAAETMREAIWEAFIQVATNYGPKEIRCLRDMLIAKYGQQGDFQRRQDQLKDRASLSQPYDDDGMAEYRLRLDPEGKEVLEAALGPLSAPKPTPGCPDLRNSDQRRAEALIEVCRRAAAAGGAAPVTTKAQVYVTVRFEDLLNRTGAGTSLLTGELLAPETLRRFACDATIIPIVLGTDSEVLDVGRARRLFTPGILRAMWLRDKGCTIPGCTAPPHWADAHHLIHWIDGGQTTLTNGALLCGRHHTIAHQRGWTATATTNEVTWHL